MIKSGSYDDIFYAKTCHTKNKNSGGVSYSAGNAFLSKTDKIGVAHDRIWRQIDIIVYSNGFTSSKFVSASFKFSTFGAECIFMCPLCSYRFNLNISC